MRMRYLACCWPLVILLLFASTVLGHSVNNRRIKRVEPLTQIHLDIAPRPESFFEKRSLTRNPSHVPGVQSIQYDDILRLAVPAFNRTFYLHLAPNLDLFHPNAVLTHDGAEYPLQHHQFRIYKGVTVEAPYSDARWVADKAGVRRDDTEDDEGVTGWARMIIRHDIKHELDYPLIEGSFQVYDDIYQIKAVSNYKLTKRADDAEFNAGNGVHLLIYRDSDMVHVPLVQRDGSVEPAPQCAQDRLFQPHMPVKRQAKLRLGHALGNGLGYYAPDDPFDVNVFKPHTTAGLAKRAPAGCPTTKKIVYMGAAADCTYTKFYKSTDNARMQIINDWNQASQVYEKSFNVMLGLINITIQNESCPPSPPSSAAWNRPCSESYPIENRLSDFSLWRSRMSDDGAGLWHLMTSCATNVEVGVAWTDQLCTVDASKQPSKTGGTEYVSGTGVSSIIPDEWKVVAHEIGHGFGAMHDCNSQLCSCQGSTQCKCCPLSANQCDAGGAYLMNPSSNASANAFSECSINTICSSLAGKSCLEDPGQRKIQTKQMCGNGIKEDGEDCDTQGRDTDCCDGKTCKYKPNAKCDDYNDLCCDKCQIRPSSYVCRPAASECDLEEKCPGDSGVCPPDKYKDDTSSCGNGMQCASGQCTSRDQQCRARGVSMNVTRACSAASGSCVLTCAYNGGLGTCLQFNGYFLDGTSCGIGGTCKNGHCDLQNFGSNVKNWFDQHKEIVIPVAIVVGLLLLFCFFRCCCYYRGGYRNLRDKDAYIVTTAPAGPGYNMPYYPPPGQVPYPPPGQMPYPPPPPPNGWVDPAAYNGPPTPAVPPPSYTPSRGQAYEMNPADTWQSRSASPQPPPQNQHREGVI
ncbi:Metallo-peptidase family M12-domain-containing protein [Radiomyces spectabilis]|uniref:Metallo-peptidase family M12-domain-containing protein n=1 Tax=Radiomyces spectabilis TaxID=64574 RepID=UPI00221F5985|nr:Metallo-peptidase family M12-domain-containing protein [Radiomyces spectabilis]KAI8377741.1 Metallo-peptidase family M12-domain-containing protein [Radiomyces spectabilis]